MHGTDEWPAWQLSTYNDTFLALIKKVSCGSGDYENFIVFRGRNEEDEVEEHLLSLQHLRECEFLLENYVPPIPIDLPTSDHADVSTTDLFDHEFAGFSVPLTFEATSPLPTSPLYRNALSPGTYRIKLVIQDTGDEFVDSAAFIAANSLKLFPLAHGDYNGDGVVDTDDYAVWSSNFGTGTKFYEGDGNGDCVVDLADYTVWRNNLGNTGNADIRSDFNRDGCVNLQDAFILYSHANTESCAGRAQGDTDGDGDVDQDDVDNFVADWLTGCGSGLLMMGPAFDDQLRAAGIDIDSTLASTMKNRAKHAATKAANAATGALAPVAKATGIIPENPDVNGDGVVDQADLAILDAMILGESE